MKMYPNSSLSVHADKDQQPLQKGNARGGKKIAKLSAFSGWSLWVNYNTETHLICLQLAYYAFTSTYNQLACAPINTTYSPLHTQTNPAVVDSCTGACSKRNIKHYHRQSDPLGPHSVVFPLRPCPHSGWLESKPCGGSQSVVMLQKRESETGSEIVIKGVKKVPCHCGSIQHGRVGVLIWLVGFSFV